MMISRLPAQHKHPFPFPHGRESHLYLAVFVKESVAKTASVHLAEVRASLVVRATHLRTSVCRAFVAASL